MRRADARAPARERPSRPASVPPAAPRAVARIPTPPVPPPPRLVVLFARDLGSAGEGSPRGPSVRVAASLQLFVVQLCVCQQGMKEGRVGGERERLYATTESPRGPGRNGSGGPYHGGGWRGWVIHGQLRQGWLLCKAQGGGGRPSAALAPQRKEPGRLADKRMARGGRVPLFRGGPRTGEGGRNLHKDTSGKRARRSSACGKGSGRHTPPAAALDQDQGGTHTTPPPAATSLRAVATCGQPHLVRCWKETHRKVRRHGRARRGVGQPHPHNGCCGGGGRRSRGRSGGSAPPVRSVCTPPPPPATEGAAGWLVGRHTPLTHASHAPPASHPRQLLFPISLRTLTRRARLPCGLVG